MPDIAVAGRAVGDVIHLLAELIENATSFSPPHTRVNVGGELVAHGLVIEIEDRGLGMSPESLAEFNARLTDPPDFDPATRPSSACSWSPGSRPGTGSGCSCARPRTGASRRSP